VTTGRHTPPPALECRGLTVTYGSRAVLRDLDLAVGPAEAVAVLGPSGCGKTTLLYTVAGFVTCERGSVRIAGRLVADGARSRPPEDRNVGVVFQNYALWPHLTALDTVAYPMRRDGLSSAEARRRAADLLDRMGVSQLAGRRPAQLSGGEQQRVGVARALARNAALYLFDEPTAHLDTALRGVLQEELAAQRSAMGAAVLYATHDVAEAFAVADRIALVRDGTVMQVAPPREVYEQPVDLWAARLTGPASVLELPVVPARPGCVEISVAGAGLTIPVAAAGPVSAGPAQVLVRPEWGQLGGPLLGRVTAVRYRGADTDYRLETPVGVVEVRERGAPRTHVGTSTGWGISRAWLLAQGGSLRDAVADGAPLWPATPGSAPDPNAPAGR
jgi:ABC-type Fe3+/spermidine/putrescine transport system ATPase subunit